MSAYEVMQIGTEFALRLTALLRERGISQSRLADKLSVSRSTVTGWLRYGKLPDAGLLATLCVALDCSADWLLGIERSPEQHDSSGGIRWVESVPPWIANFQRAQIEDGIRLFNQFVIENQSAVEVRKHFTLQHIRAALQAALRSGALRLTQVARSARHEETIKQSYPHLKTVIVADVPERYDDTVIRTEFVAFLAAAEVLSRVIRQGAVGLGVGYTLLRLCELSIPSVDQFSGTRWIPLLAFREAQSTDYTANYLARFMSVRHPGSQALYLPHPGETITAEMQASAHEATRQMQNMQTIFASVDGVGRRDRTGERHPLTDFRSADFAAEAPFLRDAYAQLDDKESFGGELLRYLLDVRGQIIGRDAAVGAQIDLDVLRYHSEVSGVVCVVAARRYKAHAVWTCAVNRLANTLVIDNEIADYLIEHHP